MTTNAPYKTVNIQLQLQEINNILGVVKKVKGLEK